MKKIIITLLALLAAAALAGCGKKVTPPGETTAQTTTAASTPTSTAEETTAETETVYPDGHYIGVWFSSDEKKPLDYVTPNLSIMRITSEYVLFKAKHRRYEGNA